MIKIIISVENENKMTNKFEDNLICARLLIIFFSQESMYSMMIEIAAKPLFWRCDREERIRKREREKESGLSIPTKRHKSLAAIP